MKVNVVTKNGMSALSVKTDFNEVLDKNLAAICDAIANKGIVLKELVNLFEEQGDEFLETVWLVSVEVKGKKEAEQSLSEELEISLVTAQYLLNTSLENLTSLNTKKLRKMLEEYKANVSKLVIKKILCIENLENNMDTSDN
jgi:DNA gyrase/topoisomerase IV subunit A